MRQVEVMLNNLGFDEGWREVDGIRELKVADGWHPWWHASDKRPEYKIVLATDFPYRVASGTASQCWFTSWGTHTGGIYRRVANLPVGARLCFGLQVQAWSRIKAGDPRKSDGKYRIKLGIDPYGGLDPESQDIVWCDAVEPYDAFEALEVDAIMRSDRATLYVWGQAEWAACNNDAYVDDAEVHYLVDDEEPEPEPEPEPDPGNGVSSTRLAAALRAAADVLENG